MLLAPASPHLVRAEGCQVLVRLGAQKHPYSAQRHTKIHVSITQASCSVFSCFRSGTVAMIVTFQKVLQSEASQWLGALFLTRGPALLPPIPCAFHPAVILVTASSRGTHQPPQFCVSVEITCSLCPCVFIGTHENFWSLCTKHPPCHPCQQCPLWSCREYWDPQGHQLLLPVTHVAPQRFLQWFSSLHA